MDNHIAQSPTIGTVCFLIDEKNDSLLLLERANEPMKGMYAGVGGKTRFDEDIYKSCIREIKEETGLEASNLKLKGIIKTILAESGSSWILFVYVTSDFSGQLIDCPEGKLKWIEKSDLSEISLIGFLREILPTILSSDSILEGTIKHDTKGNVIEKSIN